MSVCIAAITHRGTDRQDEIIAIVDRKMASDDFSNEDASTKSEWLPHSWLVMFAADDISPVTMILRNAGRIIVEKPNTLENAVEAMETAFRDFHSHLCLTKVLGKWKFKDMEEFREKGRRQFGADQFDTLCHLIDQVKVRVTFLVCGVDEDGKAHIFSVSHPGVAEVRDDPGYWAIGSGSPAAMSILSFFEQNVVTTLESTVYNVFASKLMAEKSSALVGARAYMWRITREDVDLDFGFDEYDAVRTAWNKSGKPLMPPKMEETISKIMSKRSKSQTLEGQP